MHDYLDDIKFQSKISKAAMRALIFIALTYLCSVTLSATKPLLWTLEIEGSKRKAIVLPPLSEQEGEHPLVFIFHGHGGTGSGMSKKYNLQESWPEAVVIAPDGLLTPGKYDPDGKKPGWQKDPGSQGDRDLKLFDALLAKAKKDFNIDNSRVYATGHSNGGGFSYLIAAVRPETFAAIGPSAAGGRNVKKLSPIPVFHIAGKQDAIVPFKTQVATLRILTEQNACSKKWEVWDEDCRIYPSTNDAPVVVCLHEGGHKFTTEHVPSMVRFFKMHRRPQKKEPEHQHKRRGSKRANAI